MGIITARSKNAHYTFDLEEHYNKRGTELPVENLSAIFLEGYVDAERCMIKGTNAHIPQETKDRQKEIIERAGRWRVEEHSL